MSLYLSRLRLRRDPDVEALKQLIDPALRARALDAHHRLIWTLFADSPERSRDFLWRAEARGRFLVLSRRPPRPAPLFELPEVKSFAPDLRSGDRLHYVLRANATLSRPRPGGGRGLRSDVVMHLLHAVPGCADLKEGQASQRAALRGKLAAEAAQAWMQRQGQSNGFQPDSVLVEDYSVVALPGHGGPRRGQPQFGILDLRGSLTVTEPATFLAALARGFGRAKAFGCGLMLIRRAA